MRTLSSLFVLAALGGLLAGAGPDWLNYGGDPQRSGWQQREKSIHAGNVKDLQLLWKRQLENQPKGLNALTAPVIIGPIFTHRGIKELVFVAGAADNLYAVDADLGRVFWKRHIEGGAAGEQKSNDKCGGGLTAAPVIDPAVLPAKHIAGNEDEDDPRPPRPVYVLSSDGALHKIRTSTGEDIVPAVKFIPPNAKASSLNFAANTFYTTTSDGCGGAADGVWALRADGRVGFFPSKQSAGDFGVSVGFGGTVYGADGARGVVALTPGDLKLTNSFALPGGGVKGGPVPLEWKGRELIAVAARDRLVVLDGGRLSGESAGSFEGDLATWEDGGGTRWIYAVSRGSVVGIRLEEKGGRLELTRVWASPDLAEAGPPVVANGVVYVMDRSGAGARLVSLDAATGRRLYTSGEVAGGKAGGLAVSRGHVCFVTRDNTVYCFGFPIETQP